MNRSASKRFRISIALIIILALSLLFFVYSLYSANQRSNQVEESQLGLIVDNLQLENKIVFSSIESALKLESRLIASGRLGSVAGKSEPTVLKNLVDVSDKVAAVGIIAESGEEFAIQKRKNLSAVYHYQSAADSLASVTVWDDNGKREVADSLVGNRMFNADIFRLHANDEPGKITWGLASNLPGITTRKGLSASTLVVDAITKKKYIVICFVPFKRMMTNTVNAGFKKDEVFLFRSDSLYFNFDGTSDSARGFDTTKYFVAWKDIQVKKHAEALKIWQTLSRHDSMQIARFTLDGEQYCVAFSPVVVNIEGTYCALVVPSASLPTMLRSKTGVLLLSAFALLLLTGIVFTVIYIKKFKKIRFDPMNADKVQQMIAGGENDLLEFKSTIRTNLHAGKPGKEIELAWLKSVVAFCNTEGGTILIGVKDDGELLGLEADHFVNDDKCLLHVQNLINEHVGLEYLPYVKFFLLTVAGKKILVVQCVAIKKIMLLKSAGKEQFYVRSGPSSIELPMSKVLEYVNDRKKTF
ncbi:MAG TPA: ATP-binding protein [Phnomibacter sp.]|nr:ATP-binding protein [Phnomibacter sp.]